MAYNAISGTLIAAQNYLPASGSLVANVLSGNLSTSDGASVVNVPRVANPVANGLVIDTGGDANTLRCDADITFDGGTLNVVGDITASVGISASIFVGDGSQLTNINFDNITAAGPAFSVQLHDGADGDITGSSNLTFQNNILAIDGGLRLSRRFSKTSSN